MKKKRKKVKKLASNLIKKLLEKKPKEERKKEVKKLKEKDKNFINNKQEVKIIKPPELIQHSDSDFEVREIPPTTIPTPTEEPVETIPVRDLDDLERIRTFSDERKEREKEEAEIYKSDIYKSQSIYDARNESEERWVTETRKIQEAPTLTQREMREEHVTDFRERNLIDPHVHGAAPVEQELDYEPGARIEDFKDLHERESRFAEDEVERRVLRKYRKGR